MRSLLLAPVLALVAGVVLPGLPATATPTRAPLPTHVNDCWSTDTVPPVIDGLEATPSVIDSGSGPTTVQLTVRAHDLGGPGPASGVGQIFVELDPHPPAAGVLVGPAFQPAFTRGSDGLWHAAITVPAGTNASYDARVIAQDKSGHGTLSAQGIDDFTARDFSAFDVASTTGPTSDTVPPTLTGLALSRTHVNTRRHGRTVELTATVTDAGSGVRAVTVVVHPIGHGAGQFLNNRSVALRQVADTDQWRGRLRFQRWIGNHKETLAVQTSDNSGNSRRILGDKLSARGFPSHISVVSGPLDEHGPRVFRTLRAARAVDVHRHGRWYGVRLALTDPQGVSTVAASLTRINLKQTRLHRISGTGRRGVWAGRLRVPRCVTAPVSAQLRVTATDGHRIGRRSFVRPVRILSPDHLPPRTKHIRWRIHEPVFRFTEPVHGISATNVQVYDDETATGPHPLDGSWSCRAAKGKHVGCLKGSVLEATFTPDEPGTVPGVVDWAPGLHLDVLDAHGNPLYGSPISPDVGD